MKIIKIREIFDPFAGLRKSKSTDCKNRLKILTSQNDFVHLKLQQKLQK